MTIEHRGTKIINSTIQDFVQYFTEVPDNQLWTYMGMTVEIDPTVDYSSENVLIRWVDLEEGFNDKCIYTSKKDFLIDFHPTHAQPLFQV